MVVRVDGKTYATPLRTYEAERMDAELRMLGEYGLKTKREVWRVNYTVAKIRRAARMLLTLNEDDPRRVFEGNALLKRLQRIGVLSEDAVELDYVLGLTTEDFLKRRLQTVVKGAWYGQDDASCADTHFRVARCRRPSDCDHSQLHCSCEL